MKNLKVSAQLIIGFLIMLLFIIILGVMSYRQTEKIHAQTEIIYNHPLQVRTALGKLQADILVMRLGTRNLMLAENMAEHEEALIQMKLAETDAYKQFQVLRERFLGPQEEVEAAYSDFLAWKTAREENNRIALGTGGIAKIKTSVRDSGTVGIARNKMLAHIAVIDGFAKRKAINLYGQSNQLKNTLNTELILLFIFVLIFVLVMLSILLHSIRRPIKELTEVTNRFRNGDINARSTVTLKNEFGDLAASFNSMVEKIQSDIELTEKTEKLAAAMLSVDNSHEFFREFLPVLAQLTNSQMAAVFLLTEDKQQFVHYESVGLTKDVENYSFSATGLHGEFGAVLSSRKIEHIKNIPHDTLFVFKTVSGKIIPREVITIPILAGREVIAIISLASVRKYSDHSNQLISRMFDIVTARVEGILTYRKMRKFSKQLTIQNDELEIQRREMEQQSLELTEQNRELEMQKEQLHEASRLKTNFLSNMSHELRTPLNSVIALSGVLNRRLANKIPADEYSYLEVIERNGKHLLSLINDILDISRIESGREEVEITRFNLNDLISDVVNMIQPQAKQKNIALIQDISTPDLAVESDFGKCQHILQNLIANAVKFTEQGKVEIWTKQLGSFVEIGVVDTGIGIAEHHLPHIFDEFRQADGSTSRRFGGTGLGLAIARKYANLLGGDVDVKSVVDQGSEFIIKLPLIYNVNGKIEKVQELSHTFIRPNYNTPEKINAQKTVLIVEDSEPAAIQIRDILTENEYNILDARDGRQALSMISQTIPDAMILDLMMPGVDGFEVLKSLREVEQTAHVPVLILTAKHITKEDLKALKRNNVHQLIQKGDINRNELLNAVASMVSVELPEKLKLPLQVIDGKPVVLVVEDNADNMITVKAIMANHFTVLEANDGIEAVAVANEKRPNLILMDISLPGIDGIEAFKKIRKMKDLANIPVIALTASALLTDREVILAHGFDDYLAKPIDEKLFFETINSVLYGK
ncbi:MAG: response regulator [Paludibacter sp.]|nr:response regulator [Paludibacter sp.]